MKNALFILTFLGAILFLDSCKKSDTSFTPIEVPGVEDTLAGRWTVVNVDAAGTMGGADATGYNKSAPEGYYLLTQDPNEYEYDLKVELEMNLTGTPLKATHDYNDKDAGTWEVAEDEKSVLFKGNQGIDQRLFFTNYDSADAVYMRVAMPVDTTLTGIRFKGTIWVNMRKDP